MLENNETVDMLLYKTNRVGVQLFSFVNTFCIHLSLSFVLIDLRCLFSNPEGPVCDKCRLQTCRLALGLAKLALLLAKIALRLDCLG